MFCRSYFQRKRKFKGLKLEIYEKTLDKIKKFAFLKIIFILDAKYFEMLQLCSSCGRAATAIARVIKQPRGPRGWAALRYCVTKIQFFVFYFACVFLFMLKMALLLIN